MRITSEGYPTLIGVSVILTILVVAGYFIHPVMFYVLLVIMILLELLLINFFRDPDRLTPEGEHQVIAPADGKIIKITALNSDPHYPGECTMVSIFMNVFDVHVNRNPVSGTVQFVEHKPGKFLSAFLDEAPLQNEQTVIGIRMADGAMVVFKQIAGLLARRVVCNLQAGQSVQRGARMGMIKFGSRVDVLLPVNAVVSVKCGDRVRSGESVIARMNGQNS